MLNEAFTITPRSGYWCELHWTVTDSDLVSWVFLDGGKLAFGPLLSETLERSLRIPFIADATRAIEIHDLPAGQIAQPVFVSPNTKPTLRWNPVESTVRYRIYHQTDNTAERKIYDAVANVTETKCPVELIGTSGVWHFLRVEAVDEYGNKSTRQSWRFYASDLPLPPATLTVTDGDVPGTFTFNLEQ